MPDVTTFSNSNDLTLPREVVAHAIDPTGKWPKRLASVTQIDGGY
jgi:hypothetical protein